MQAYELLVWTDDMVKKYWDYHAQFPKTFFTYSRSYEIIRQLKAYLPDGEGSGERALCSKLRYLARPDRKRPHLVVIAGRPA